MPVARTNKQIDKVLAKFNNSEAATCLEVEFEAFREKGCILVCTLDNRPMPLKAYDSVRKALFSALSPEGYHLNPNTIIEFHRREILVGIYDEDDYRKLFATEPPKPVAEAPMFYTPEMEEPLLDNIIAVATGQRRPNYSAGTFR